MKRLVWILFAAVNFVVRNLKLKEGVLYLIRHTTIEIIFYISCVSFVLVVITSSDLKLPFLMLPTLLLSALVTLTSRKKGKRLCYVTFVFSKFGQGLGFGCCYVEVGSQGFTAKHLQGICEQTSTRFDVDQVAILYILELPSDKVSLSDSLAVLDSSGSNERRYYYM